MPNEDGTHRLAYAAAIEADEVGARLRRTQLVGVLALAAATLAVPVVRLSSHDDYEHVDDTLDVWRAIGYLSAHAHDHAEHAPRAFGLLTVGLGATVAFSFVAVVAAIVLAVRHSRAMAFVAAGVIAAGVLVTVFCLVAASLATPEPYADLAPTWALLLPAALGLWTGNVLQIDD